MAQNLAGKTYEVFTADGNRWIYQSTHDTRSAALEAAEGLLGAANHDGVRVVSENLQTGEEEVLFEERVDRQGDVIKIVGITEAAMCGDLADFYIILQNAVHHHMVGKIKTHAFDIVFQFMGIVGKNGSGKTTLLKCIVGSESFDGQIESGDMKISLMEQEGEFGQIQESFNAHLQSKKKQQEDARAVLEAQMGEADIYEDEKKFASFWKTKLIEHRTAGFNAKLAAMPEEQRKAFGFTH